MTLAEAIAQMEGFNVAGSLAQRNNNPGNLKYVGQAGASKGAGGFAAFSSADAGWAALDDQINLDASRGLSLSQFTSKYAPSSENNTSNYLDWLTTQTGIQPNDKLTGTVTGDTGSYQPPQDLSVLGFDFSNIDYANLLSSPYVASGLGALIALVIWKITRDD